MASKSSTLGYLALAAVGAIVGAIALTSGGPDLRSGSGGTIAVAKPNWTATAPGRVEPVGGEVRLTASAPGKIMDVLVRLNDQVVAGDLLVRLEDEEARARVLSADSEAAVRKRERDPETAVRLSADRRQAEDAVANAERAVALSRTELDRVTRQRRMEPGAITEEAVSAERSALVSALAKLEQDRLVLRRAGAVAGIPLPTRLEAGLTQARAELSLAEAAFERTRIRAPRAGTILQIHARAGETAAASPEQVLLTLGDLSSLRVRAEVEERDVANVRLGQTVSLRADSFPSREFAGKVAQIAQALAGPRLPQRGPRRPNDVDTLEVMIDVDAGSPLLPGMRVDVYFKVEPAAAAASAAPTPASAAAPAATPK